MSVTRVELPARRLVTLRVGADLPPLLALPDVAGAVVRVLASGPLEEARRLQREAARLARAGGAVHVVLDPPERPVDAPAAAGPAGPPLRGERPAAAAARWLGAHPSADADLVMEEVLDAVAAAEGAGS